MSGNSSVGQASVYEAGDQRNSKDSETKGAERFKEGKPNSHLANDSSKDLESSLRVCIGALLVLTRSFPAEDQRSIANKLAREGEVNNSCLQQRSSNAYII